MDCFVASLLAMTAAIVDHPASSYPAHAGYPVRRGLSIILRRLWNTGSPGYLRPHPEERALARVSKDGRESVRCGHPSRRLLCKLLRMRSVFPAMRSLLRVCEVKPDDDKREC